jgi:hypothetical protein
MFLADEGSNLADFGGLSEAGGFEVKVDQFRGHGRKHFLGERKKENEKLFFFEKIELE